MTPPVPPLGRRGEREPATIAVKIIVEAEGKKVSQSGWMLNVSKYGARLRTSRLPHAEEEIEISSARRPALSVRGRVVWSRKPSPWQDGEMGVEFLRQVPIAFWSGPGTKAA